MTCCKTGIQTREIQRQASSPGDCDSLYQDEGRREACSAHEWFHILALHYVRITPEYIRAVSEKSEEAKREFVKIQSKYEIEATLVGIGKANELFNENCKEGCDNE